MHISYFIAFNWLVCDVVVFQVFYLKDAIDCSSETRIHGDLAMLRQERNKRLYNMHIEYKVDDAAEPTKGMYEIP